MAAMSTSRVFVKRPREAGRVELCVEDVQQLSVERLKEKVAEILDISMKEFRLVYAGRVLKAGKMAEYYKIVSGCTIYVLKTPPNKQKIKISGDRGRAAGSSLLSNRRVIRAICRILSNPGLLRSMIQGTDLDSHEALINALGNRQLIADLSNPDSLQEYLQTYPQMAMMMENIIRMYGLLYGGLTGETVEEEQEIIDMVERNFEDDLEDADPDISSPLAQAQEQMFEHSQALHAHQQQRQTQSSGSASHSRPPLPPPSSSSQAAARNVVAQETSFSSSTSQQVPRYQRQHSAGGTITQQQLASALAGAMGSSPLSSMDFSTVRASSAPSSLSSDQILQPTPGPSHHLPPSIVTTSSSSTSHHPRPVPNTTPTPSASSSGRGGTSSARRGQTDVSTTAALTGGGASGQSVTGDVLQQALANAISSIQTPSEATQSAHNAGGGETPRQRYAAHLTQLHAMGISDDAACLQALEATGGDLQAALEILYSK